MRKLLYFFLLTHLAVFAQKKETDTHQYDAQIKSALAKENKDSLLFFSEKKLALCRSNDSFELYIKTIFPIQDVLVDAHEKRAAFIQTNLDKLWRKAKSSEEAGLLLDVYVYEGYLWWRKAGNLRESIKAYEKAHLLDIEYSIPANVSEILYKPLSNHYTRLGDNEKAKVLIQKGLTRATNTKAKAGHYCNLGIVFWNQGAFEESKNTLETGLALHDVPPLQTIYLNGALARTLLSLGQPEECLVLCATALKILEATKIKTSTYSESKIELLLTAGDAFLEQKKYEKANQSLRGAQKIADTFYADFPNRIQAKIRLSLAALAAEQGRFEEAIQQSNVALSTVIKVFEAKNNFDLPDPKLFYNENSILEALACKARFSFSFYEKTGQMEYLYLAEKCHNLAWQAEMQLRGAYIYTSSKFWIQQQTRQREAEALNVYHALFEVSQEEQWIEKAYMIAERSKALVLLEALKEKKIWRQEKIAGATVEEIRFLQKAISDMETTIGQEGQTVQRLQKLDSLRTVFYKLNNSFQKKNGFLPETEWFTTQNPYIQNFRGIDEDEIMLTYFMEDSLLNVFVFSKNTNPIWERIPFGDKERQTTRDFLAFFSKKSTIANKPKPFLALAHQLWGLIIPKQAIQAKKILIIPDGLLSFVPFDALLPTKASTLQNAQWALKNIRFRNAYSYATLLLQMEVKGANEYYFLGFAPIFKEFERGLNPLIGAASEWIDFGFFTKTKTLLRGDATKKAFFDYCAQTDILHLATHATGSGALPRIECIDTALYLPEIYAMDIHARLVVLSACETSLGKQEKGEGVLSLARAFTVAGAAATLSSLWEVSDAATSAQFDVFYTKLKEQYPPSEALRAAKLAYLKTDQVAAYKTPYYWAALVFVGADTPVKTPIFKGWPYAFLSFVFFWFFFFFSRKRMVKNV